MITRRSLFGLTFGGAVASAIPASSGSGSWSQPSKAVLPVKEVPAAPPMRITLGATGHACKVEIAGVDVSGMCTGARIMAEVGDVTRLQLDMLVVDGSEIIAEPGALDIQVRNLTRRLRFEADNVRVKADV